jgi:hypothetical protein
LAACIENGHLKKLSEKESESKLDAATAEIETRAGEARLLNPTEALKTSAELCMIGANIASRYPKTSPSFAKLFESVRVLRTKIQGYHRSYSKELNQYKFFFKSKPSTILDWLKLLSGSTAVLASITERWELLYFSQNILSNGDKVPSYFWPSDQRIEEGIKKCESLDESDKKQYEADSGFYGRRLYGRLNKNPEDFKRRLAIIVLIMTHTSSSTSDATHPYQPSILTQPSTVVANHIDTATPAPITQQKLEEIFRDSFVSQDEVTDSNTDAGRPVEAINQIAVNYRVDEPLGLPTTDSAIDLGSEPGVSAQFSSALRGCLDAKGELKDDVDCLKLLKGTPHAAGSNAENPAVFRMRPSFSLGSHDCKQKEIHVKKCIEHTIRAAVKTVSQLGQKRIDETEAIPLLRFTTETFMSAVHHSRSCRGCVDLVPLYQSLVNLRGAILQNFPDAKTEYDSYNFLFVNFETILDYLCCRDNAGYIQSLSGDDRQVLKQFLESLNKVADNEQIPDFMKPNENIQEAIAIC